MITTERLNISIASNDEMRTLISEQTVDELKTAYSEMLTKSIEHPKQRMWYATWLIKLTTGKRIGELCFKGLSSDGTVEIGYGLLPEFWGNGYATEAVKAMVTWALKQQGIKKIEAETEPDNVASQRVLEKAGFSQTGEHGNEGLKFIYSGSVLQ